ncbi:MAG: NAD(P)-dependent oxidoreductase [Alsobacter sp.]
MRILVTGAAGFVGRRLVPALAAAGHDVVGADLAGAHVTLDLRDRAAVLAAMVQAAPEVVVHAGAISGPMLARDNPALVFDVNVAGTLNVVDALGRSGVRRLVHLSSVAVYRPRPGDPSPTPVSAALGSDTPYGASKVAAEAIVEAYAAVAGLDAWVLRISSVYGPGRTTPYLVSALIGAGRRGGAVALANGGGDRRQFVHVDDVVAAIAAAVARQAGGCVPVNVSGGDVRTEEEIARLVRRRLPELRVDVTDEKAPPGDGDIGPLDLSGATRLLGLSPRVGFEAGLDALLAGTT